MLEHIIQSISEEHKFTPNIEKRSLYMANNTQHNTTYNTLNSTQYIPAEEVLEEKTPGNIHPQIESIAAAISGINAVISDLEVQLEPILKARPVGVEQDKTNYPPLLPRDNRSDLATMLQRIACDLEIVNTKLRTLWAEVDL